MDEEELRKKQESYVLGQDLSLLSVEEIGEMVDILKDEISRLEEAGKSKTDHLSAAEALFKS